MPKGTTCGLHQAGRSTEHLCRRTARYRSICSLRAFSGGARRATPLQRQAFNRLRSILPSSTGVLQKAAVLPEAMAQPATLRLRRIYWIFSCSTSWLRKQHLVRAVRAGTGLPGFWVRGVCGVYIDHVATVKSHGFGAQLLAQALDNSKFALLFAVPKSRFF